MILNNVMVLLATLFTVASCNSTDSPNTSPSQEETVQANDPKESISEDQETTNYLSGITKNNSGSKKGKMELKGHFSSHVPANTIFLYETEGRNYSIIDSAKIVDSSFDFGKKEYERGFYMFSIKNENNMVSFIMNPDEKLVELEFRAARLENGLSSVNSKENQGWVEYYKKETQINTAIQNYKKNRASSSVKGKFDKLIADKQMELITHQHNIIKKYPDTYLAKVVTWNQIPHKKDLGKFWDDIDFTDESLIHCTVMPTRIQEYMIAHSKGTDSGFINCVDITKQAADKNSKVLEFVLYTMLDGFYSSNKELICQYILDNYIFDEDCGADLSDVIKQRAGGIVNLQIGKTPPDFTIQTHNGGVLNLRSELAKYDYTLVFFWSSWCHKCEQEIPVLKQTYLQYHNNGFQVIGVSMDTDRTAWLGAIEERDVSWPNVSQLNSWKSPVAKDYKVNKTPTLFLLDKNGKILLKPKRIFEVNNFLKKNIK